MTDKMHGFHRAVVIAALGRVPATILSHDQFVKTAKSLMTPDMNGEDGAVVIATSPRPCAVVFGPTRGT